MPTIRWKVGAKVFNKSLGIPDVGWKTIRIGEQKNVTEAELTVLQERYGDAFEVVEDAPKAKAKAKRSDKE